VQLIVNAYLVVTSFLSFSALVFCNPSSIVRTRPQLAVCATQVFAVLIVAVCHVNVCRHANEPRAANRTSARGTLSN